MKSAYELALERAGVETAKKLTDKQKEAIAELDKVYKAKKAEADITAQNRIMKAGGDVAAIEQIKQDLAVELASIESKQEKEKEKIRNS